MNFNLTMTLIQKTDLVFTQMIHMQNICILKTKFFQIFIAQVYLALEDNIMIKIGIQVSQQIILVNVKIVNKKYLYFK